MRPSDIVSGLDLTAFPEIGLVLFLAAFLAVAVRVLRAPRSEMDRCAALPIEERAGEIGERDDA